MKKNIVFLGLGVLALLILAGCSQGTSSSTSSPANAPAYPTSSSTFHAAGSSSAYVLSESCSCPSACTTGCGCTKSCDCQCMK